MIWKMAGEIKREKCFRLVVRMDFTHLDEKGNAKMVDISEKNSNVRKALARGEILVGADIIKAILNNEVQKGDVLSVARIGGVMAVKKTAELIPMCHQLLLTSCKIDFEIIEDMNIIKVSCEVLVDGKTGVEMEALTGVSVALLTIYDMCKAINKGMEIRNIYLERKSGGKSGLYERRK